MPVVKKLADHRYRRTTIVAVFCASVLVGVALSRIMYFDALWPLLIGLIAMIFARKLQLTLLLLAVLAGLCLGGWRGSDYMQRLQAYEPVYGTKVTLVGYAAADGVYNKRKQLSFDIKGAQIVAGETALTGKIGVSGFGENMIYRGDRIAVTGKLRKGTGSHQGWMSFATISVIERETSVLEKFRREFNAGMMTALPEPLASFGMGILVGQRSTLPEDVYDDLLKVGLVHIIAVSGYNLTIILRACWRLLGKRSKFQTLAISVALIVTFLLITGASASIVRASIISGLSLAAWYYGRNFRPVTLILLAAAITAMASPLFVWSDLGWYLSFLAFYGVLVLAPQIRHRFIPERLRNSVLLCVALESICAEIITLPLVLYIFGQMSHVSLLANVVIAIFVPIAMLLSVIAGLAGMFAASVVGWLAWPAVMVLTYMLDMAKLLASIPGVFVQNIGFSLAAMVVMYGLIFFCNLVLHSRLKRNRAIINTLYEEHTLLHLSSSTKAIETR